MPGTLVDFGGYPEIYADGIGDVFVIAPSVHILLFHWKKLDGLYRKCIAGEVVRPIESFTAAQLAQWERMFCASAPAAAGMIIQ